MMIAGSCLFARSAIQQRTEEIAFRAPGRSDHVGPATDFPSYGLGALAHVTSRALASLTLQHGSHLQ